MGKTLFDKIWDAHVVQNVEDGPTQLYIDRLYAHEVTSPQAFDTLRDKNIKVFRPDHVVAMPDHNTPSDQQEVINAFLLVAGCIVVGHGDDVVRAKSLDALVAKRIESLRTCHLMCIQTVDVQLSRSILHLLHNMSIPDFVE